MPAHLLLSSAEHNLTSILLWILIAVVGLSLAAMALYTRAVRVDRLHRQVLGSRATLEAQLVHRAQAAAELSACTGLDPALAGRLATAAHEALDHEGPLVDDGLDPDARSDAPAPARSRALVESGLSRAIRTVVHTGTRETLSREPDGAQALARLDRACYRLTLARRFHNTHVAQARRLRSNAVVRLFHLAGHAPMPRTFDIDDDAASAPAPASPGAGS